MVLVSVNVREEEKEKEKEKRKKERPPRNTHRKIGLELIKMTCIAAKVPQLALMRRSYSLVKEMITRLQQDHWWDQSPYWLNVHLE